MAGRAGAGPAAFGFDARNGVADRGFHHGRAVFDFNGSFFAGMVDKVDFGHDRSCCRNTYKEGPRQSYNGSIRAAPALGVKTLRAALAGVFGWGQSCPGQERRRIASIADRACATASPSSTSRSDGSEPLTSAASNREAASATPNAPIARAEPFSVWASAPASAG